MQKNIFVIASLLFALSLSVSSASQRPVDGKWLKPDSGISVPVPPAEHPRLYLRSRDIADLKRRIAHPVLKPVWEDLQKLAEKNTQNRVMVDALRHLIDPDPELARRTIEATLDTLQSSAWEDYMDVSRPIGRMMVTAAVVYDWCYDYLKAEEKEEFIAQLIRLARLFEIGYPITRPGSLTGHIGEWMIMRDMLSAGMPRNSAKRVGSPRHSALALAASASSSA